VLHFAARKPATQRIAMKTQTVTFALVVALFTVPALTDADYINIQWPNRCSGVPLPSGIGNACNPANCTDSQGRKQGCWLEYPGGYVLSIQGFYVDGMKHGRWVEKWADGTIGSGSYVAGKAYGMWFIEYADGGSANGRLVNNKQHGPWIVHPAFGDARVECYKNGNKVDC